MLVVLHSCPEEDCSRAVKTVGNIGMILMTIICWIGVKKISIINARRMRTRVTVVCLCVCMFVCYYKCCIARNFRGVTILWMDYRIDFRG